MPPDRQPGPAGAAARCSPGADPDWLVRTWFALVHAAGDRVRETPDDLATVTDDLVGTLRRAWGPDRPVRRGRR